LISSTIQAIGLLIVSLGLGLIFIPAGITALGVSFVLFGLALEKGK
jgi:uncharacterized membrane protein YphA (DoxX/SURF4 family)